MTGDEHRADAGTRGVAVLDAEAGPELEIVAGVGSATAIVWPGMGTRLRSLHRIRLGAGARTIELSHPGEAVYYVLSGSGEVVDPTTSDRHRLVEGSIFHVEPRTTYEARAGERGIELIGGPSPADPGLYERLPGAR